MLKKSTSHVVASVKQQCKAARKARKQVKRELLWDGAQFIGANIAKLMKSYVSGEATKEDVHSGLCELENLALEFGLGSYCSRMIWAMAETIMPVDFSADLTSVDRIAE